MNLLNKNINNNIFLNKYLIILLIKTNNNKNKIIIENIAIYIKRVYNNNINYKK